jgi:hypothetical protein
MFSLLVMLFAADVQRTQAAEFDRVLSRIPDDANTLILLNVESIFGSTLAQSENWKQTYADSFAATPLIVPPNARRFALAAAIEIETMEPIWEVASMEMSVDPSIDDVAQRIGGVTDRLSGVQALWPRNNMCVVKFGPSEFAVLAPASRQSAARWAGRAQRQAFGELTPYLKQAARYAESAGPEIVMAIDLDQILRPESIQDAVKRTDFLSKFDHEQVTNVLTSLRGLTLGVRVTDRIYGKLLVDFGQDASILQPVAKQLVVHVLTTAGAMLDEINDWTANVRGTRISLEGSLSTDGMRRLFSLVTLDAGVLTRQKELAVPPAPTEPSPTPTAAAAEASKEVMATASLRYFRSIVRHLNDLQRPRRSSELSDIALWINNFARRIERLPTRNVDPDLLAYGQSVVYGMRDAVGYLQGVQVRIEERQSEARPQSNVSVGALPTARVIQYGPYVRVREYVPFFRANVDIGSALAAQERIAAEEYEAGTDAARQIMERLKSETDNMRQVMSQRYGRQF